MRTFLVATDFSLNAMHASDYATQLAAHLDAKIILMHAYEEPVAVSEYELSTIHYDTMKGYIVKRLQERKNELQQKHGKNIPIECIACNNDLIGHIRKLYHERDARLLFIGLTGSGMANYFLGSNTLHIVNQSECPTVTVPPRASFKPIRKVVFACDLNDLETSVPVARIHRILTVLQAELKVLNIRKPDKLPVSESEIHQRLQKLFPEVPTSFQQLERKNIVAGIKDYVRQEQADLVIVIPRKHDTLNTLLKTNHTKAMLFRSSVPILTIPPLKP